MKLLTGLVLLSIPLGSGFQVDLPESRSITVTNDWHDPYLIAHEQRVNQFLGSQGLGIYRSLPPGVPGMHSTLGFTGREIVLKGGKAARGVFHDLVGVAASPQPRVYCVNQANKTLWDKLFGKRGAPDVALMPFDGTEQRGNHTVAIRKLDWFEQAALAQLQAGHAYCCHRDGEVMRGLGAIRAQASCLRCHDDAKEGDLLGAFTYLQKLGTATPDKEDAVFESVFKPGMSDKQHWDIYRDKVGFARPPENQPYAAAAYVRMVDHLWQDRGVIRDSLIDYVKAERSELESKHLLNSRDQTLYGWEPSIPKSVKRR